MEEKFVNKNIQNAGLVLFNNIVSIKKIMVKNRPLGIDLFCGAGGMSLGFEQAGFEVAAAIDHDPIHIETYSLNFPHTNSIQADINKLSGDSLRSITGIGSKEIDVVFGGPPCGGFSMIGKRQSNDPRNTLLISFARLVIELQPKYFVVENVRGLFLGEARKKLHGFCQKVEKAGYKVIKPIKLLNAMDMGVPQSRVRVIILGYKNGNKPPLYPRENNKRKVSVWDALGDLPNIQNLDYLYRSDIYNGKLKKPLSLYSEILRGESDDLDDKSLPRENVGKGLSGFKKTKHTKTTIQRFSITNPGETEKVSHFFRLPKDDVARTLRAGSPKSHGGYTAPRPIHPEHPRCITVREGARLHSFPDWFDFHPTIWHGFRQLGNSVPPLLARSVAKEIYKLF